MNSSNIDSVRCVSTTTSGSKLAIKVCYCHCVLFSNMVSAQASCSAIILCEPEISAFNCYT